MDNLIVYKDNYLVEASYKLTLIEQRLMLYCISKLNPQEPHEPQQRQVINIDDFCNQFRDVNKSKAYGQIKDAINSLYERSIKVKDPEYTEEFRWIQSKKYFKNEGTATIEFSNSVMPYLCQLEQQFTKYQLRNISGFKRTYSIRLYELLTQYRSLKSRVISVADLRNAFLLDDKFVLWADLKRYVIEPSVAEINEKSDLKVAYKPLRLGRSIAQLEFFIEVDNQIDMFEKQTYGKSQIKKLKDQLNGKLAPAKPKTTKK